MPWVGQTRQAASGCAATPASARIHPSARPSLIKDCITTRTSAWKRAGLSRPPRARPGVQWRGGVCQALDQHKRGGWQCSLPRSCCKASHREFSDHPRLQEGHRRRPREARPAQKSAAKTVDELLTLYDDDEEGWFYRWLAQRRVRGPLLQGPLHVNPLHPGANHELVHFYGIPAAGVGLVYAENFCIKSSPGIPHPAFLCREISPGHAPRTLGQTGVARPTPSNWSAITRNERQTERTISIHHLEI